jgi:hypothetical protein
MCENTKTSLGGTPLLTLQSQFVKPIKSKNSEAKDTFRKGFSLEFFCQFNP